MIAHAPKGDFDRRRIPANTQRKHIHGKAAAGDRPVRDFSATPLSD